MARRRSKDEDWRPAFLEAFAEHYTVTAACKAVGISRVTAYHERRQNETFREAWADVEEATTEWMEREALRRAVEGVVERGTYDEDGKLVGEFVRKFSDTLLIFMLKARRPAVYRENVFVDVGGEIDHHHDVTLLDGHQPMEIEGTTRRAAARALLEGAIEGNGHVVED